MMMVRLTKYARPACLALLAIVTAYGIWRFATGDSEAVLDFWRGNLLTMPVVLGLAAVDVALECAAWMWVYARFGMRVVDSGGLGAFLAGRAGLLLPVQLGRLIRPDSMARLRRGATAECLKAEAVVFALDVTSVGALLAAVGAWVVHPLAAPVAMMATIGAVLFLGNRFADMLSGTHLALPRDFWLRWQTVAIVLVETAGWFVHGVALWILVRDLPGDAALWESVFFSSASAVLGAGTGLPGGVGATEGLLGVSLRLMSIPPDHLALAVGGFRLLTFWIWIPIGWASLIAVNRRAAAAAVEGLVPAAAGSYR